MSSTSSNSSPSYFSSRCPSVKKEEAQDPSAITTWYRGDIIINAHFNPYCDHNRRFKVTFGIFIPSPTMIQTQFSVECKVVAVKTENGKLLSTLHVDPRDAGGFESAQALTLEVFKGDSRVCVPPTAMYGTTPLFDNMFILSKYPVDHEPCPILRRRPIRRSHAQMTGTPNNTVMPDLVIPDLSDDDDFGQPTTQVAKLPVLHRPKNPYQEDKTGVARVLFPKNEEQEDAF